MSVEDLRGVDFEWFAIDEERHVGVFTTAGAGPVPRWIADDDAWCDADPIAFEALPSTLGDRPRLAGVRFANARLIDITPFA